MDTTNRLIRLLLAIQSYCKDIHYNSKGDAFYGKHLLVDRVQENISEYIDQIKELFFLPTDKEPLPSEAYLTGAAALIPSISEDDRTNFQALQRLITNTLQNIEDMKGLTIGEQNLIGAIAQDLQTSVGLIARQVK